VVPAARRHALRIFSLHRLRRKRRRRAAPGSTTVGGGSQTARKSRRPCAGDAARSCPDPLRPRRRLAVDRRRAPVRSPAAALFPVRKTRVPIALALLNEEDKRWPFDALLIRRPRWLRTPSGIMRGRQAGPSCQFFFFRFFCPRCRCWAGLLRPPSPPRTRSAGCFLKKSFYPFSFTARFKFEYLQNRKWELSETCVKIS
jgi:hypothetical protein